MNAVYWLNRINPLDLRKRKQKGFVPSSGQTEQLVFHSLGRRVEYMDETMEGQEIC